ncbi:MAG: tryptophan 2,3-dioxygenase family protein [Chitinophagaceae bacterium]
MDDNSEDLSLVRHRLHRVVRILELLNQQVGLMDTMTPLDFLEFRNLLTPSSGFQSLQFRLVETTLGLAMESRHNKEYYKRSGEGGFDQDDLNKINETESKVSLINLINNWLERMPFFEDEFWKGCQQAADNLHPFWSNYREIYKEGLTEREAQNIDLLDFIFFEKETV